VLKTTLTLDIAPCALGAAQRASAQRLTQHDQEHAPYSTSQADGSVPGPTVMPAAHVLRQVGLICSCARTSSQRQRARIQEGAGPHRGVGWFRNPERSLPGKFSKTLYRDRRLRRAGAHRQPPAPGVSGDEALVLRRVADASGADLRGVTVADLPTGQPRHRCCSRTVPDAWLARIDQALAARTRSDRR
jgi:hypothetical protein